MATFVRYGADATFIDLKPCASLEHFNMETLPIGPDLWNPAAGIFVLQVFVCVHAVLCCMVALAHLRLTLTGATDSKLNLIPNL